MRQIGYKPVGMEEAALMRVLYVAQTLSIGAERVYQPVQ